MKSILFDSYAILCFYQDEEGADEVERLLIASRKGECRAFISEINLGEVHYKTIRRVGLDAARRQLEQFAQLPVEVVHPASDIILSPSELKAEHAISYADCFAIATALNRQSSIATGDPLRTAPLTMPSASTAPSTRKTSTTPFASSSGCCKRGAALP